MLMEFDNAFHSPFIVPVAACVMVLGIVAVSKLNEYATRKLQFEERMAAIAKGIPLPESPVPTRTSIINMRLRMGNVRRGGIVLVAAGIGIAFFFSILSWVVQERDVLSGAAASIIPFAIGIGLLIDARLQTREMAGDVASPGV